MDIVNNFILAREADVDAVHSSEARSSWRLSFAEGDLFMLAMFVPKALGVKVRNRTQTVSYYWYTIGAHRLVQFSTRHFVNDAVQCERSLNRLHR